MCVRARARVCVCVCVCVCVIFLIFFVDGWSLYRRPREVSVEGVCWKNTFTVRLTFV